MKNITLIFLILFSFSNLHAQSLYNRSWGSGSNLNPQVRVAEVNQNTNELFIVYENFSVFGGIYILNANNSSTKLFYEFPNSTINPLKYYVLVDQLKFDSNNNLIVYGRTHNPDLGTTGTYSKSTLPTTIFSGYTFIAKINREGKLTWLSYFHDLDQYKGSLTIDKNNNIYVLNKRNKSDVLSSGVFQRTGDLSSTSDYQNVISKLDTNGRHLWSTFYFNDKSDINTIVAADDGLYAYGAYIGTNSSNNYFSTKNSFQEYPSGAVVMNDQSTLFLSKFGFDGKRLWSTYFGSEISKIPSDISYTFPQTLVTIGNDAYFLSTNRSTNSWLNSISTPNTYISKAPDIVVNTTLTKFLGNGTRDWTTYLYLGSFLQKTSQNDILVTSNVTDTNSNLNSLITSNAYQANHGGKSDIYHAIISNDGKSLKYGSFYGYDGNDQGVTFVTPKGLYVYGYSLNNSNINSSFSTTGETFSGTAQGGYFGYFSGYFSNKSLSNKLFTEDLVVSIYPNPTSDFLNVKSVEILAKNTSFIVYDISGKKVLNQSSLNSNLNQINVSHLNSGVYILQIEGANINQSIKFIKK